MPSKSIAVCALLLLAGCASPTVKQEDPNVLAKSLGRLSAAMESYLLYEHRPPGASQEVLFSEGTRGQPGLLEEFDGYRLVLAREQPRSMILVCTRDGKRALMEDLGCTPKIDRKLWEQADAPCEFTLEIKEVCQRR